MSTDDRRAEILTQEYMHEAFEYIDGNLFWKERPLHHFIADWCRDVFNKKFAGKLAGTLMNGYLQVNFGRCGKVAVHRIIFLMHHGFLPINVDHKDGNPLNNQIDNLRAATYQQNAMNMKTRSTNTSGRKGVYAPSGRRRWTAAIRENGKFVHLGSFGSFEEAAAAREEAEKRVYGEFANER